MLIWIVLRTLVQECTLVRSPHPIQIESATTSGADSIRHGGTCPPLLQMAGHGSEWVEFTGGTVNKRPTNMKLTKLYWPFRKRSPQRLIVLLEPKEEDGHYQKNYGVLRRTGAPTFKFVPAPLCDLGILLDSSLSRRQHIRKVGSTCLFHLRRLRNLRRRVVDLESRKRLECG